MEDAMLRNRIRNILQDQIARGMGYDDMYGNGGLLLGSGLVPIEGGRRRRSSRQGAFGRKVGAYMRKHGVTLAEAAHALKGSGAGGVMAGRRRRVVRRRRVGRPRGRGVYAAGARKNLPIYYADEADYIADMEANRKEFEDAECAPSRRPYMSAAELKRCINKENSREKAYRKAISSLVGKKNIAEI